MKNTELGKFTLLTFHYFKADLSLRSVDLNPIVTRLERDAAQVDQGVFVLRSYEDRELIDEAVQALQKLELPFALVQFGPDATGIRLELHMLQATTLRMQEWGFRAT